MQSAGGVLLDHEPHFAILVPHCFATVRFWRLCKVSLSAILSQSDQASPRDSLTFGNLIRDQVTQLLQAK
jgi:hypothetical protein